MTAIAHTPDYKAFPALPHKDLLQRRFEVPALVRALGIPEGLRVLEVGCGRGVALGPLWEACRPAYLAGLELECRAFSQAARRIREENVPAQLFQADVRDMPFRDGSFDVVVDFGTCFHIAHAEQALQEIERVLARGGLFVSETPTSQLLAHPFRTRGRRLPWSAVPAFRCRRRAVLWSLRAKTC